MGIFEQFPYSNLHNLNLDWILKMLKEFGIVIDGLDERIKQAIKDGLEELDIIKLIADAMSEYGLVINVKAPPKELPNASGDGSTDDTITIQGCIDYAHTNGGGAVFFPSGAYLTQSLDLKSNVSLVAFDCNTSRIVLKGGATRPLINGTVSNSSILNLTLDGNMDIQVNNIDLLDISGSDIILHNLKLKDGYNLLKIFAQGCVRGSLIDFGSAVVDALIVSGIGEVQFNNLVFHNLSTLNGRYIINNTVDNAVFESVYSTVVTDTAIHNRSNKSSFVGRVLYANNVIDTIGADTYTNFYERGGTVKDELAEEIQNRINADLNLQELIDLETENRKDEDIYLQELIDIEIQNRQSKDDELQDKIDIIDENIINIRKNYVSVIDFGAKGDGVTDDTLAFINAIDSMEVNDRLTVPNGIYKITSTITINKMISIEGVFSGVLDGATLITDMNAPLFHCKAQCHIEKLVLLGSLDVTKPLQCGVFIDDINAVTLTEVHFSRFYDNIKIYQTSFYCRFNQCVFYNCVHAMIYGYGNSVAGYQFELNNSQIVSAGGEYGFLLENLGSVIMNHVEVSPTYLGTGLWIKSQAPQGGAKFFNQLAMETYTGVKLGSESNEVNFCFFNNCYIASEVTSFEMLNASSIYISTSYISCGGSGANGSIHTTYNMNSLNMSNCEFQGNTIPFTCDSNVTMYTLRVSGCNYRGVSQFMYIPNVLHTKIGKIEIIDCSLGSHADPVQYTASAYEKVYVMCSGYYNYPVLCNRYYGELGTGGETNITVLNGIHTKAVTINAYERVPGFMLQEIEWAMINSSTIQVFGGTEGNKVVLVVQYTPQDFIIP